MLIAIRPKKGPLELQGIIRDLKEGRNLRKALWAPADIVNNPEASIAKSNTTQPLKDLELGNMYAFHLSTHILLAGEIPASVISEKKCIGLKKKEEQKAEKIKGDDSRLTSPEDMGIWKAEKSTGP